MTTVQKLARRWQFDNMFRGFAALSRGWLIEHYDEHNRRTRQLARINHNVRRLRNLPDSREMKNAPAAVLRLVADARESLETAAKYLQPGGGLLQIRIYREGRKISVIKAIRSITGWGLRESKQCADQGGYLTTELTADIRARIAECGCYFEIVR